MATLPEMLERAARRHQAGDLRQAEALYRHVLQDDPNHVEGVHRFMQLHASQKRYEEVAELLRPVVNLRPEDLPSRLYLGEALMKLGQFDEACGCFEAAVALA